MAASRKRKRKGNAPKKRTKAKKTGIQWKALLPWIGLVVLAAFVSMWPVIQAEFTELDDKQLILKRSAKFMDKPWRVWTNSIYSPHYKPLVLLSWVMEGKIFGLESAILHFNNLLLHAINSVLAFFITLRLSSYFSITSGRTQMVALFAALLFAVHPLHVESVAWAIERKDVLYTLFFFLGILAYFRYLDKPGMKWMLVTTVCFAGSALSKAPAIVFPAVLVLIDWLHGKPMKVGRVTEKWPVMIMFVLALFLYGVFGSARSDPGKRAASEGNIARMVSEKPVSDVYPLTEFPSMYTKVALIGVKGLFWYGHTYVPVGLSLAYPYRAWLPSIGQLIHIFPLLFALGLFVLWRWRERYKFLFFSHVFFLLALAPALIRTGLGKGIFLSDRYVYLGLLGLALFIAGGLLHLMSKKQWPERRQYAVLGALVVIYGAMAFFQSQVWRTGETLWSNVIDKYPSIDYAYVNRAIWYKDNNRLEEAMADLNVAVSLDQFDDHALIHRGTLLRQAGNKEAALADFNIVLARKPDNEHAINGKANVLFEMGRYAEAEQTYTQGMQVRPRMVTLWVNRAAARYFLGKNREALEDLAEAERMAPNYGSIFQKRTVILMSMGDYENAVISARKTAQFEPENHANYGDMGVALQRLGRHQEAIEALTQAIQIFSRGARYYRARADSYEALGNMAAADQDRRIASGL